MSELQFTLRIRKVIINRLKLKMLDVRLHNRQTARQSVNHKIIYIFNYYIQCYYYKLMYIHINLLYTKEPVQTKYVYIHDNDT